MLVSAARGGRKRLKRWYSLGGSALEFATLKSDARKRILSLDPSLYPVGLANESTRETWLKKVLSELPSGARLLDAGAGECPHKKYCEHLHYVSQDLAKYDGKGEAGLHMGSWDTSRIDIVSDITDIPAPDASFDAVLCAEVLEHITDPTLALAELARLLKPGGTLIVTAPFCSFTHFAPYHYATGFSRYFYEHHLRRIGFDIVELVENGSFFEFTAMQVRMVEPMAQRYAGERLSILERFAIQIVLSMLERFSTEDKNSDELLNYGIFVRATKRPHAVASIKSSS